MIEDRDRAAGEAALREERRALHEQQHLVGVDQYRRCGRWTSSVIGVHSVMVRGTAVVSWSAWSTPPMRPPSASYTALMLADAGDAPETLGDDARGIMIAIAREIGDLDRGVRECRRGSSWRNLVGGHRPSQSDSRSWRLRLDQLEVELLTRIDRPRRSSTSAQTAGRRAACGRRPRRPISSNSAWTTERWHRRPTLRPASASSSPPPRTPTRRLRRAMTRKSHLLIVRELVLERPLPIVERRHRRKSVPVVSLLKEIGGLHAPRIRPAAVSVILTGRSPPPPPFAWMRSRRECCRHRAYVRSFDFAQDEP